MSNHDHDDIEIDTSPSRGRGRPPKKTLTFKTTDVGLLALQMAPGTTLTLDMSKEPDMRTAVQRIGSYLATHCRSKSLPWQFKCVSSKAPAPKQILIWRVE